ncbi:MAG: hypothetical protein J0L87_09700 [Bacteroidetes bacterium]|nr:hypothetical protein [Bacteroidota bacterium]
MDKVSTSVAEMHIDDDGILQIRFFKGTTVTLEKIKEYYRVSNDLLGGKKALVLIDASEDYTVTDDAKAYGQTDEATKNRIAIAYVTGSVANRIMFNLYLKIYKPNVPLKMFTSKSAALKWLNSFYVLPGEKYLKQKK